MNIATQWIDARKAEIATALGTLSRPGEPYALLDWPHHSNIGDSAIWLGEMVWAREQLGRMPSYATQLLEDPSCLDRLCPEGTVFIHGGGNFGDVWKRTNDTRIDLLTRYRHRKIVQLPQSIHFSSAAEIDRMKHAISQHPDFTIMVRDTVSLEFSQTHFDCTAVLCPDMAFMLGPLPRPVEAREDVFCLLRTDKEKALDPTADMPGPIGDWIRNEPPVETRRDRWITRAYRKSLALGGPGLVTRMLMSQRVSMMNRIAEARLHRGLDMLAQGRQVLTDRLHAHILCTLMGIHHVVLDNSYGKLGRVINSWPPDGYTTIASDMAEAKALLQRSTMTT